MLTLFSIPSSVEKGTQEFVLDMGTGGSTNGLLGQLSTGPYLFDSIRFIESGDFTEPAYSAFYSYGYGPPNNFGKTSKKGENPVSHLKLDGQIIFDYRDQNVNLPYVKKEQHTTPLNYWSGGNPVYRDVWKWQQDNQSYALTPRPRYDLNADVNAKVATLNRYDMTAYASQLGPLPPLITGSSHDLYVSSQDRPLQDSTRTNTTARNKIRFGYSITPWGLSQFVGTTIESTAGTGKFHDAQTTLVIHEASVDSKVATANSIRFNYKGQKTTLVIDHVNETLISATTVDFTAYAIGYPTTPRLSCSMIRAKEIHLDYLQQNKINRLVAQGFGAFDKVEIDHYATAHKALDQLEVLDMNNIENLVSFKEGVRGIMPPYREFLTALKDPENPFKWLKASASSYLWYSYVAAPTAGDLTDFLKVYDKVLYDFKKRDFHKFRTYRAKDKDTFVIDDFELTLTKTNKIKVRSRFGGVVSNTYFKSKSLGLNPSLKNLWDLVPYSFVADWFVNVGELADAIDYEVEKTTYDIAYNLQGAKLECEIPLERFNLSRVIRGTPVTLTRYERSRHSTLPEARWGIEYGLPSMNKILLGSSLIVTRR